MSEPTRNKKRQEIAEEFKWAITDMYASDELWENEYHQIQENITKLEQYEGKLLQSASMLYEYLQLQDATNLLFERVYVYANQKYHEDTTNATYQKLSDMAGNLGVKLSSATSYAVPELMKSSMEQIKEFVNEVPELSLYGRYYEILFRKKEHILSDKEEKILAMAGEVAEAPSTIFSMFNNADVKFDIIKDEEGNDVELTHSNYSLFIQSKDREVRKNAFNAMYAQYIKYRNTLANMFSSNLKQENFFATVRKYPSTMAKELDGGNIPISVYDNLLEAVHERLPLLHRYVTLRKKILRVDELHMYDLYTPMVGEIEMKIPYEEAKEIVAKALTPLGAEYAEILEEGFTKRWIDVYENEGKRSGAYSWGAFGTHPYVLLNYQNNLNNMFTLAHEMGHAIHSYYSDREQPFIYAGYKIFVAEVASTCNEALLMHYMLKETTDTSKRAYLINYYLEQFRTTLYRQTMFAEFEKITHQMVANNEPLTADALGEIYRSLNQKYFGPDLLIDDEIAMEWARIPHFYNAFYVYQYATGYSAAVALSTRILNEGEAALNDYLGFLQGGNSKDPIDLLKGAGVDMTTKEPVLQALQVFEELLDEIENLLA